MARAFSDGDIVQAATGTEVLTTLDIDVTLPAGTMEGNAGIIVLACQSIVDPPEQWHLVAPGGFTAPANPQAGVLCRADIPADETAWTFSPVSGGPSWVWLAQEWRNVSYGPVVCASASNTGSSGATSVSTGSTGTFDGMYTLGIAYVQLSAAVGGSAWPTATWSDGFTETDVISIGDGTGSSDLQLRVARRYGTPDDPGPWETTATFTGTMTAKTPSAVGMAVFRAENHEGEA